MIDNNQNRISVIVPIYNVGQYIEKCICSILAQTYSNLEIILVDDGSTDESGLICDLYAGRDERIVVIHKENGGLVSARKAGLEMASGDFVGFVDGDDYIFPTFYEILVANIKKTGAEFAHGGYLVEGNGASYVMMPPTEVVIENNLDNTIELFRESLLGRKANARLFPSVVSKIFRKEFVMKCYGSVPNDLSQGEDAICLLYSILEAKKISIVQEAQYCYQKREGSLTDYAKIENLEEIWKQYSEIKMILRKYNVYQYVQAELDIFYYKFTINIIKKIRKGGDNIQIYYFDDIDMLIGKKIIIFGAGCVGQDYYSQICKYRECEIVSWIDSNYQRISFDYANVEGMNVIQQYDYDYIVIAIQSQDIAMQVKRELMEKGVPDLKIVWHEPKLFV